MDDEEEDQDNILDGYGQEEMDENELGQGPDE